MCVAAAALNFCPGHSVAGIRFSLDRTPGRRSIKAGPTRPRVVLGVGSKQRLSTADASVSSWRLRRFVFASKWWLSALLAGDMILIRRELLLPILFRLRDLFWQFSLLVSLREFLLSDSAQALDVAENRANMECTSLPGRNKCPNKAGHLASVKARDRRRLTPGTLFFTLTFPMNSQAHRHHPHYSQTPPVLRCA
jgi:hypothetical protein